MITKSTFTILFLTCIFNITHAAKLQVDPAAPQPGDILTLTIWPQSGEDLQSVEMNAFDTPKVLFCRRSDGSFRGYLGVPYDRSGGKYPLPAKVHYRAKDNTMHEQDITQQLTVFPRNFVTQHITMKGSTATMMSRVEALHKEKKYVQSKLQHSAPKPLWKGNWIIPVKGQSTSSYGRKRYVNGKWWGQHSGADIRASTGTPVHATNSGRVVLSEYLPALRGNCIIIDHGCNIFSIYMHLSKRLVKVGDSVKKNQLIGKVGHTGFVTGPHLHWTIRVGWEACDPFRLAKRGLNF
jgi:murein DD-endopeptidase MepM/ murein hydrolase activator NlpD